MSADKKNTADYRQIAFKLQDDIKQMKWEQAQRDIPFLREMKQTAIKAFDNNDAPSKEYLLKMIDDWVSELEKIN